MKRLLRLIFLAVAVSACGNVPAGPSAMRDDLLSEITPEGWIKEALVCQKDGLSGHPEALSYPYNTALWDGEIQRQSTHGEDWWRYEQTAYYTDGILKLGYLLGDSALVCKGEAGVRYCLDNQGPDGRLGVARSRSRTRAEMTMWPLAVFFRAIKTYYEKTGDERVPAALERHYLSYPADTVGLGRNMVSAEGMLWTYGITGNTKLLELAENAYREGTFPTSPGQLDKGEPIVIHGVTFCELMKVPVILYMATGDTTYLNLALRTHENLVGNNMLPDGVPTSAEWVKGKDVNAAHETCDIADFTWSDGYFLMATGNPSYADEIERAVFNAFPGAVTNDFRALQYFSCLNQFRVTGDSDHNEYRKGLTWMAYRPTHETECCAGNVHRILPNYVGRMWMSTRDGIAAALYGPSSVKYAGMSIREETSYPKDETVLFRFSGKPSRFPFYFRIPGWCKDWSVAVNGKEVKAERFYDAYSAINRRWKDGDCLQIRFEMPVEFEDACGQGVCVRRGPLLYSYPIPFERSEDTKVYPNLRGKHSENPDFKCWRYEPAGAFNYAIVSEEARYDNGTIQVPVRRIEWSLDEGRYTPAVPDKPKAVSEEIETITLVPYGSTELRLTVFPKL